MPKPRPPYIQGNYYHFYNRGSHKQSIFHNSNDYTYLLGHLKTYAQKFAITIIAYCLLPNHYHILARQDNRVEARVLIQRLFNRYGKTYREKYTHSGTIFEGPYRVKVVTEQRYLLHLCRYIHANPVKHGIVTDILDWPYSNYPEWIGIRQGTLVDKQFINDNFPNPGEYKEFVRDYLLNNNLPDGMDDYLFYK
jgi:REP element-mobilizing transposase RayT